MPKSSIATPCTITMKYFAGSKTPVLIDQCQEYTIYIKCHEYKELPIEANVRKPEQDPRGPYRDMLATLNNRPLDFFENNLGISAIAKSVTFPKKDTIELSFETGMGILNGGHTQKAIISSQTNPQLKDATVKLTIRKSIYTPSRISQIAAAQNSSISVSETSLADKRGAFDALKKEMGIGGKCEKKIIWYEGRDTYGYGMDANDVIAILAMFNIDHYESEYNKSKKRNQPVDCFNGKKKILEGFQDEVLDPKSTPYKECTYEKLYPLCNDILCLYEYIKVNASSAKSILSKLNGIKDTKTKKTKNKRIYFSTEQCLYDVPIGLLYPIIAAFRADVYYSEKDKEIGWWIKPEEIFDDCKSDLYDVIKNAYNNGRKYDPTVVGRDKNSYQLLYNTVLQSVNRLKNNSTITKYPI